jgi:phage-related protein
MPGDRDLTFRVMAVDFASPVFEHVSRSLDQMGKAGESFGKVGLAIALGTAAVEATALSSAIAPAVGVLGVLPAAGFAAAGAFATVKIATHGMGDAFKAVASGDSQKLNEALKGLAPAAQKFVKEVAGVRKQWAGLAKDVQQQVFAPLIGQVKALSNIYLPIFKQGLHNSAVALGGWGQQLATTLNNPTIAERFKSIFSTNTTVLNNFRGAIDPIITALTNLAVGAGPLLTQLSNDFVTLTQKMSNFFTNASQGGGLQDFFLKAYNTLKEVLDIVFHLGDALFHVFSQGADSGKSLLDSIDAGSKAFDEWSKKASTEKGLKQFFDDAKKIADSMWQTIKKVGDAVQWLLKQWDNLSPRTKDAILKFAGIAAVVGPIAAKLSFLGDAFSAIGPALEVVLGPVGLVAAGLAALGYAIYKAWQNSPAFREQVRAVGEDLKRLGDAALPVLKDILGWIQDHLIPGLEKFVEKVMPGVRDGVHMVATAILEHKQAWKDLGVVIEKVASFLTDHILPLLGGALGQQIKLMALQISAGITGIADGIELAKKGLQTFGNFFITMGLIAIPALRFLANVVLDVMGSIVHGAASAFGWVPGLGGKLKSAAKDFDTFRGGVLNSLDGAEKGLKELQDKINGVHAPPPVVIHVQADISQATAQFAKIGLSGAGIRSARMTIFNDDPRNLRAAGGPVKRGQPYVVGEKRPELFVPDANGTILPSVPTSSPAPFGGAGGTTINLTVNAGVGADTTQIVAALEKMFIEFTRRTGRPLQFRTAS